jgi:hypothetical protein
MVTASWRIGRRCGRDTTVLLGHDPIGYLQSRSSPAVGQLPSLNQTNRAPHSSPARSSRRCTLPSRASGVQDRYLVAIASAPAAIEVDVDDRTRWSSIRLILLTRMRVIDARCATTQKTTSARSARSFSLKSQFAAGSHPRRRSAVGHHRCHFAHIAFMTA